MQIDLIQYMSQKVFFTPGPTQLYFTVPDHLKAALREDVMSISHRSKAFEKLFATARERVSELLNLPPGYDLYFTGSANEIWERVVQNLIRQHSHHFINGAFAQKFHQFALEYQKDALATTANDGWPFDHLEVSGESELIAVTLNETSTGFMLEQEAIDQLREKYPEKLIAVDGVSAFPSVSFDFSKTDTAYFSVQKSFGLPAGLGVWIVNDRCYEKAQQLESEKKITGSYHRLMELKKYGAKNQTPETPNILGIYLLGKVAEDMLFRSAKTIQNETTYKAAVLYQALEQSTSLNPFVQRPANRSKTVVVAECQSENTGILSRFAEKGWIIGSGYGGYKQKHLRIANFPMHSKEIIENLADELAQL